MKQTVLILALAGFMAPSVVMPRAAGSVPAATQIGAGDSQPGQPHPNAAVPADEGAEALLSLVMRQVLAGKTMAPEGDNAIFTWRRLLKVVVPHSPATVKALNDFVSESRRRAADEQAAGQTVTARELSIFADEATDMLKGDRREPPAASSAGQVAAPPAEVPPGNAPSASQVQAKVRESGDAATADHRRNEAALEARPTAVPSEPDGGEASIKMASRNAGTVPETSAAAAPSPPAEPLRPADRQAAAVAAALSRGDAALAMKNVAAARSLYEYAANAGNARAAAALAETYDPIFLNRLGAIGPRPDPGLAAEWYRKAAALGDRSAAARLQTLRADAGK